MSTQAENEEVVVVGLGYVGLTLAAHLAYIGMNVYGVEIRDLVLSNLNKKRSFFLEENLDDILNEVIENKKFSFGESIPKKTGRRIFIITVGTPLTENLTPNLDYIKKASTEVANAINDFDLVVLRSTVKLGVTNQVVRKILESSNKEFSLAFCPERTLEGAALKEISLLPQIIGADNLVDHERAKVFFEKVTSTIVPVSNIETAEMIKLVDNMQRDTHFAISNEVARMCNQVNVKASEVISAGKINYPRTNLPTAGPVGGPCLEKDTYLLNDSFKMSVSLSLTARKINELIVNDSIDYFVNYFGPRILDRNLPLNISLIGLAFKGVPETNDLRGSVAVRIINSIKMKFPYVNVKGFDSVVSESDISALGITNAKSLVEAFEKSDLVLLVNNHPNIKSIDLGFQAKQMNPEGMIYDYWGRFDNNELLPLNVKSVSWGSHSSTEVING
jgi:UDP-N-acetyl-D-mannosaminuronic acid dehydrogenase